MVMELVLAVVVVVAMVVCGDGVGGVGGGNM